MSTRPLALPNDLSDTAATLVRAFQYPAEWGVQFDEQEQFVESIGRMRRIWALVRPLQLMSPALRDIVRGFVWEELEAIEAMTMPMPNRERLTENGYIGTAGVLPEFRRRGPARKLVLATLDMMSARDGTRVTNIYRSLGSTEDGGSTPNSLNPRQTAEGPKVPGSYTEQKLAGFVWCTRYELDGRIVPEARQRLKPIGPWAYLTARLVQALAPTVRLAQGVRSTDVLIHRVADGIVVARAGWTISTTSRGVNAMRVRVDPAHGDLTPCLVGRCLTTVWAGAQRSAWQRSCRTGCGPWRRSWVARAHLATTLKQKRRQTR